MVNLGSSAGPVRRFLPRVEELAPRCLPACNVTTVVGGAWDGGNLVIITDGADPERIIIRDNGGDGLAGLFTVTCDGALAAAGDNVSEFIIRTRGGNDAVHYQLTSDLVDDRHISVSLGGGADAFQLKLYNADAVGSDIEAQLQVRVHGGAGNDLMRIRANLDVDVAALAGLFLALDGGAGDDRIRVNFNGELDGEIGFNAIGSFDKDTVRAQLTLDAGSTGRLGRDLKPAIVHGGEDNDTLAFLVQNDGAADVFAELYGGASVDELSFTANVGVFP